MKISENTEFKIDIKTVIGIIMLTTTFVGMYYTLQEDIAEAKTLPPTEVTRLEYELKEEWNEKMIIDLSERVNMLEQIDDVIFEEINVLSTLIKDGTESDGKLEELNRQLDELRHKKPKAIKEFGLPLVLLLGALYALYRFMVFALYEVKKEFSNRHETNAKKMEEVKIGLAEIKSDMKVLVEFLKEFKTKIK